MLKMSPEQENPKLEAWIEVKKLGRITILKIESLIIELGWLFMELTICWVGTF